MPGDVLADSPVRSGRVSVAYAGRTHTGKVRSHNEDQFLIARLNKSMQVCASSLADSGAQLFSDEEGYLLVVADGMGGASGGEHASALAVATVEDFTLNTLKWFLHLGGSDEHALLAELRAGLDRADRAVHDRARVAPRLHGMGTTLTLAFSVGRDLYIVHAGDTRAYLLRGGSLKQLTRDHTLVQMLVSHGALSPEDARTHRRRNVVTNVVGGPSEGVHADVRKVELRDGDALLLCSDGLSSPVGDEAIAEVLSATADPGAACDRLIGLALERGAPDNVTAVVARYRVG
jgi:serine/threonine protein phosphatase PrpC